MGREKWPADPKAKLQSLAGLFPEKFKKAKKKK